MEEGAKQQPASVRIQDKEMKSTTSVRVSRATRPIMIVGQDESVFAQYLLGSKTWVGPKGQRPPLLPKSEGDGFMISAFVSREFVFGRELLADELVKINTARQGGGRTYIDTLAALEILNHHSSNTYILEPTTRDIGIAST
jgi:hypothetical protein